MINTILVETGADWDILINDLQQDTTLLKKIKALSELFETRDFKVDFDKLYFEAEFSFIDSLIGGSDIVRVPVLQDVNYNTDQIKMTFHTIEGNVIVLCLKGHSDSESRVSVTQSNTGRALTVTPPDCLDFTYTLNSDTVIVLHEDYSTDFKVDVVGEKKEGEKFKLSDLHIDGSEMAVNTAVKFDKYNMWAKANYDVDNGFQIGFAGYLSNKELVSGDINLKCKVDGSVNWANVLGIVSWAGDSENQNLRGIDCNINLNKDLIRMKLSLDNPLVVPEVFQLLAILAVTNETAPVPNNIQELVDKFNKIFKGELYFRGYDQPQAVLKMVYTPTTKAITVLGIDMNAMGDTILRNFDRIGLSLGFEVYDDNGIKTFVTVKDYFKDIDFKGLGEYLKANFEEAFSQVISSLFVKDLFLEKYQEVL